MTAFSKTQLAQTLYQKGITVFEYEPDKASFILENEYPNSGVSDSFNEMAFDIFLELMKIEMNKND